MFFAPQALRTLVAPVVLALIVHGQNCINEIPFYTSCIAGNVRDGCPSNCNIGEVPEDCDAFACWLASQEGCCADCADQLQDIVDCRGCGSDTTCAEAEPPITTTTGFDNCINEFPFWVSCIGAHVFDGCPDRCMTEFPESCDDFQAFYEANKDCCTECGEQFNEVIKCSGCGTATVETSDATPGFKGCVNEFPFWLSCVYGNTRDGCPSQCTTEYPESCDDFETFYESNKDCCPDCNDQLNDVVACAGCTQSTQETSSGSVLEPASFMAALLGVAALV